MIRLFIWIFLLGLAGVSAAPDYERDLTPILREYCAGCHNEDDYDGEFSVETFASIMEGGEKGDVITPGDSAKSRFMRLLKSDSKSQMPPKDEPQLSAEQIALFEAWINAGAKGPKVDESILMTKLDVPKIKPIAKLHSPITAAEYSPDGSRLALAKFGAVELIDVSTDKVVRSFGPHPGKVNAVHFSPDGEQLLTASGITGASGVAHLWQVDSGKMIREFGGHRDILYDAEFSPDGTIVATAGYDRRIRIWKAETAENLRTIEVHNGAIYDLAFSPDGTVLASASADETVKLWQVSTGKRLDTLNQPEAEQFTVSFSPDGKFIFAGGADNRIRKWRFVSQDKPRLNPLVQSRFAHEGAIVELALSSDGKHLVSAADDFSLKIWGTGRLDQLKNYEAQSELPTAIVAQPKGNEFLVARLDGTTQRYPIQADQIAGKKESEVKAKAARSNGEMNQVTEAEPNDSVSQAAMIALPATISGKIGKEKDADLYRFQAEAGEQWVIEVNAERKKSVLDSKIEILHPNGEPVEWVKLQAVRDSWFTFRGQDSNTSDGFRLHNWEEMELNEYLYANGEITKLWLYPRGPDSGFKLYPGSGKRYTYFGTTALTHPVGEPCYIVRAHSPDAELKPNGLPEFTIYYENDDDPGRRLGKDSRLTFTAPAKGEYVVRISDVRGFGDDQSTYELIIRPRRPDFKITVDGMNPTINKGSGKEFRLKAERMDGFEGKIQVDITGLPEGFSASSPIVIQPGQEMAMGVLHASDDAAAPAEEVKKGSKLTATALIGGKEVQRDAGTLGEIKLADVPKLKVELLPDQEAEMENGMLKLKIKPGETITAKVRVQRNGYDGRVQLGKEDAGRNFAHGVYVDNIGLNGLLIPEKETERTFFITAAGWVPGSKRYFHLQTSEEGKQASAPAIIEVVE